MKTYFILISISLFIASCSNNQQNEVVESDASSNNVTEQEPEKIDSNKGLPKYNSVEEMFIDANDFNTEQGTLKLTGDNPSKIQVSQMVFDGDTEDIMKEQVKRDIIYVVFQTFAHTELNDLTVTSVPLKMKDFQNREGYLESLRSTIEIDRDKAQSILMKFLNINNFESLYSISEGGELWLPNDSFNLLKFKYLEQVYNELEK